MTTENALPKHAIASSHGVICKAQLIRRRPNSAVMNDTAHALRMRRRVPRERIYNVAAPSIRPPRDQSTRLHRLEHGAQDGDVVAVRGAFVQQHDGAR